MTYGVYTRDLKGVKISELHSVDAAKVYCYDSDDAVVCSEKEVTTGLEVTIKFSREWHFRLRPSLKYMNLGFVHTAWRWTHCKVADKVVYDPKNEGVVK